jgi:hypothetical protein
MLRGVLRGWSRDYRWMSTRDTEKWCYEMDGSTDEQVMVHGDVDALYLDIPKTFLIG